MSPCESIPPIIIPTENKIESAGDVKNRNVFNEVSRLSGFMESCASAGLLMAGAWWQRIIQTRLSTARYINNAWRRIKASARKLFFSHLERRRALRNEWKTCGNSALFLRRTYSDTAWFFHAQTAFNAAWISIRWSTPLHKSFRAALKATSGASTFYSCHMECDFWVWCTTSHSTNMLYI